MHEVEHVAPDHLLRPVRAEHARARGVDVIRLRAATSAERSYAAAGYAVVGADEYALPGGPTLPCIRMEKRLDYEEPRPERRRNAFRPMSLVTAPPGPGD